MTKRRVVVTGMGLVTPIGNNVQENREALWAGKSGIGPITRFDASIYGCQVAGEVKNLDASGVIDPKEMRRMDRFAQYALVAADEALKDADITDCKKYGDAMGIVVGSGMGGLETLYDTSVVLHTKGGKRVSPFFVPMAISNMAAGHISIQFGIQGGNYGTVSACSTGAHAIGDAMQLIRSGDYDLMVAGGSEATILELAVAGFSSARALATDYEEPSQASRPFDTKRSGFVMGEGAGILILEEYEHAKERGAKIYGEVLGFGMSSDAYHITAPAPNGEGGARSMRSALKNAGIQPEDVDYINAHGTSTPLGDEAETLAIKAVFGDHAYKLAVSSTKSMTGHSLGAAGAMEAAFALLAIEDQKLPPTINLENPDPACDLDYVPNQAREAKVDVALSNSFGFGGTNATLVFKRV